MVGSSYQLCETMFCLVPQGSASAGWNVRWTIPLRTPGRRAAGRSRERRPRPLRPRTSGGVRRRQIALPCSGSYLGKSVPLPRAAPAGLAPRSEWRSGGWRATARAGLADLARLDPSERPMLGVNHIFVATRTAGPVTLAPAHLMGGPSSATAQAYPCPACRPQDTWSMLRPCSL